MKRFLTAVVMTVGMLNAQQPPVSVQVLASGAWPACESATAPYMGILCAGFVAGREQYMLVVGETEGSNTTGYRYSVTGTLKSTGQTVTISDFVPRSALFSLGNTYTSVLLNFGGIVGAITYTVETNAATGTTAGAAQIQ